MQVFIKHDNNLFDQNLETGQRCIHLLIDFYTVYHRIGPIPAMARLAIADENRYVRLFTAS